MSFKKACTYFKRYFVVPVTSLLTVGLVGYISWVYLTIYCPKLYGLGFGGWAVFLALLFSCFPILIYSDLI